MKIAAALFITLLLTFSANAQISTADWEKVENVKENILIDKDGLTSFTGEEIFVWVIQEFDDEQEMEILGKDFKKTKTYYQLNKNIKKYNIIEIIYYDEDGNVLKSFTYDVKKSEGTTIYNYPIMDGTMMSAILSKCVSIINAEKE